jgi:hypothetical protein
MPHQSVAGKVGSACNSTLACNLLYCVMLVTSYSAKNSVVETRKGPLKTLEGG